MEDNDLVLNDSEVELEAEESKKKKFFKKLNSYKPPFNYVVIRFIALLIFALSQATIVIVLCTLVYNINEFISGDGSNIIEFSSRQVKVCKFLLNLAKVSLSLLYITMFSLIFQKRDHIVKHMIKTFVLFVLLYIGFALLYTFVIKGLVRFLCITVCQKLDDAEAIGTMLYNLGIGQVEKILSNVNVFLDAFVCTTIFFFLFYTPKKMRNIKLFRALVAIPLVYVAFSISAVAFENLGYLKLNFYTRSLLVSRKFSCYAFFIIVSLALKIYEIKKKELPTPFIFILISSISLGAISLVEFGLNFIPKISKWGFGGGKWLFLGIPFVALYNFYKKSRFKASPVILYTLTFIVFVLIGILYVIIVLAGVGLLQQIIGELAETLKSFLEGNTA